VKTIWKFPLVVTNEFSLPLPRGAQFLSVQAQHGDPQTWWLVDPNAPRRARKFRIHGTGHEVYQPGRLTFLGTFQLEGGALVFHLFEEKP
jgi:hypothetical protein